MLDLFAEEATIPTSSKMRRTGKDNLEAVLRHTQRMEFQQLDTTRWASILDKEMHLAHEHEIA